MSTPPDAGATDDNVARSLLPGTVPVSSARGSRKRSRVPHAERFRIALAMLVGIAFGAIAIAVAVAVSQHDTTTTKQATWSSWSPDTSSHAGVTEIANHVAPYYRVNAAQQLDVVTPLALTTPSSSGTITGSGLTAVVNTGSASAENLALLGGHTVAYNICGLGSSNCSLTGKPSAARLLLLRREALELALYTFKYVSGVDNVITVLPPGRTQTASKLTSKSTGAVHEVTKTKAITIAVLFVRPELQPWLNTPINKTISQLPLEASELPLWSKTNEAGLVDQITARGLFSSSIESQQSGGSLLVLRSIPPQ